MWLLDVNVPKKIIAVLKEFDVLADTAEARGWRGLKNGALGEIAVEAGFTCVLTRDRLFSESAARALKRFPNFSIVLINIPQLRGPEFLSRFTSAWQQSPIRPLSGKLIHWP